MLRTDPSSARRVRGAPFGAHPARFASWSAYASRCDAAGHGRPTAKPRRRRCAIGEHQGQSSRHDVGETVMPGAMVLATFAETKVARAHGMRAEKDKDVEADKRTTIKTARSSE